MSSPGFILFEHIIKHREILALLDSRSTERAFDAAVALIATRVTSGGKILICGNGGSAADAQHLAAECVIRYQEDREPIPAIALTADTAILTAGYNDGYTPFQRQVQALGGSGDVLIALSTSGTSQNVVQAIYAAQNIGMSVIGLTGSRGFRDNRNNDAVPLQLDIELRVPSDTTSVIQEMHIILYHALVEALEREIEKIKRTSCRI